MNAVQMPAKTAVKYVVKKRVEFYANAIWSPSLNCAMLDACKKSPSLASFHVGADLHLGWRE
jgi:hypothetical protein